MMRGSSQVGDVRRVLIVAPSWLGDAVMSLPLLGYLASAPGLRITVLASEYTARVYWGIDAVSSIVVEPRSRRHRQLIERGLLVHRLGFDGCILLPSSFSSALTMWLSGVPVRVGFAGDGRRMLLTRALPRRGLREEHLTRNYIRLGDALLEGWRRRGNGPVPLPRTRVFDDELMAVTSMLDKEGSPGDGFFVVVPGATYGPTKTWPVDKYRRLVGMLGREAPVVLAGSAAERELCDSVADRQADVYNLAGRTRLGEFFALLTRARALVANDSGAPHVAASLCVPTTVIFGSTSPTWTAPVGDHVAVIREPVACSPCFLKSCPTKLECYQGISPERVFEATLELVNLREAAHGS